MYIELFSWVYLLRNYVESFAEGNSFKHDSSIFKKSSNLRIKSRHEPQIVFDKEIKDGESKALTPCYLMDLVL